MGIHGAKTYTLTECPNCKTKEPKTEITLMADRLGYLFIIFKCCNTTWQCNLIEIGTLLAELPLDPNLKSN